MIKINKLSSVVLVLILSILLAYASFSGGKSEAYIFPKLLSTVMIILSFLSLVLYFYNKNEKITEVDIKKLSIYLGSLLLFLVLGELLGFYFLAVLIFLIICYVYSEKKNKKSFFYNFLITLCFMIFIYFLFAILLKVQAPRFFLF
ncbi:tripartite tricarboxylate transporter TctB family protein [Candidatus Pelagibacter sp. Uisw_090]|uniref:tripartite tricarboxylate transporter TctB family protein n=1 Tax=Candidatus Pelagibacter sp. Uisw_090 TaxID=3230993 RepID=UPI0039E99D3E